MVLKILSLFLILFVVKNVYLENNDINFSVVSTSQRPSNIENSINDRVSKIELQLEMRAAISALKESISHLQSTKQKIFDEIEGILREQVIKTKEIVLETEQNVKKELTEAKNKIAAQINQLRESTKVAASDAKKELMEVNRQTQNQIKELQKEFDLSDDFNEIKTQLTKAQKELLSEIQKFKNVPSDCKEVQKRGYNTSGIYRIQPMLSLRSFLVWCDMSTREGGWTYVINRFDGSQNFYRNWTDYKQGFGNLSGEHWLGLDHLYELTNSKPTELLFELIDWDSKKVYALYDSFQIGNEFESYCIKTVGNYKGDAGNSFNEITKFSTADNDHSDGCPESFEGAWWYTDCYEAHLTGKYINNPVPGLYYKSAIKWNGFHGYNYSLKKARMMIRPLHR